MEAIPQMKKYLQHAHDVVLSTQLIADKKFVTRVTPSTYQITPHGIEYLKKNRLL